MMMGLLENILMMALVSAPWLLLGLVAAGLIHAWLPMQLVGGALGGSGPGPVLRAALIGAPLPLCSCGTLPAAFSLHRSGASRASTTSFMIATPETGVDSVALSWVLLGPFMALLRPFAAILSAVTAGLLVGRTERDETPELGTPVEMEPPCESSTCDCCCGGEQSGQEPEAGFLRRTLNGLRYAFSDLLDDLALWLAVGIALAGVVMTLAPPDLLAEWGSGPLAMLLILAISVPMYVCATASTPLAHAMLYAGISPGTVLVFLLAGPASNLGSVALVRKELGRRALIAYLVGVAGVSILLGVALDLAIAAFGLDILGGIAGEGGMMHEHPSLMAWASLLLLLAAAIKPLRRGLLDEKARTDDHCCG
jgi:uncharacterized membrane protein YraQ (UPF0718 family)